MPSASPEATTRDAFLRRRSWKRPVLAAVLVFGITMAGITVYELTTDTSFSGGSRTTVGEALSGHNASSSNSGDEERSASPTPPANGGDTPSSAATSQDRGTFESSAEPSPTPTPSATKTAGDDSGASSATSTSSASATPPAPDASSRSGTSPPAAQ